VVVVSYNHKVNTNELKGDNKMRIETYSDQNESDSNEIKREKEYLNKLVAANKVILEYIKNNKEKENG